MSSGKGVNNLSKGVSGVSLGASDGDAWEEVGRKYKNKAKTGGKQWGQTFQHSPPPKAWGQPDTAQRLGMRSTGSSGSTVNNLNNDHQRRQGGSGVQNDNKKVTGPSAIYPPPQVADQKEVKTNDSEEDEGDYTDDDDDYLSDGSDSDDEPKTHEAKKKIKLLKKFFTILEGLSLQEINDPERQWHCPACHGGPGAIDWYKGLQPLVAHAKNKGSQRVKLHRTFAEVLEEELRTRGTSVVPSGESFGQWEGLKQETKDHDIIWPPMVVIMNTVLDKDDNDKWIGMGNQELIDNFKGYAVVRAKHAYGPMGHRGFSVVIFESSAVGYVEAERLHRQFLGQGTGRSAWESNRRVLFHPGGLRQLYGFLARKDDLEEFNKHCQGKSKLKYEVRSYQEMVVAPLKQMHEDNQQLSWFRNKAAKDQRQKKALEESFNIVSEKLRQTMEQNRIVRQRTIMQHEENKEEMDFQEQFFKDQIQKIHDATDAKEDEFEKLQQEERKRIEESKMLASDKKDVKHRAEMVSKFKELQDQEIEKFVAEREKLTHTHNTKKLEMKKRHGEEEVLLEKEYEAALTELMDKYAPRPTDVAGGNA